MLKRVLSGAVVGLAGVCLAASARADVANFNDINLGTMPYGNYANSMTDGGLAFADQTFTIGTPTFDKPLFTTSQFMEAGSGDIEPLVITLDDGGKGGGFDLTSFKMGLGDWNDQALNGSDLVTITGYRAGCQSNCSFSVNATVGYNWTIYDLSGFTDVSEVTISQPIYLVNGQPAIDPNTMTTNDYGWLAFDDFNYVVDSNQGGGVPPTPPGVTMIPGPIPEPSAWALMIMGFGVVGATLRRRRTTAAA